MPEQRSEQSLSKRKIDAVYELREAAEEKGRAEEKLVDDPSPEQRDKLLDSMLEVEHKTVNAIAACHECGQQHELGEAHGQRPR